MNPRPIRHGKRSRSERVASATFTLASSLVVLALFAGWGSLPVRLAGPPDPASGNRPLAPEVTYMTRDAVESTDSDVRLIRSPVLFSLPHPRGYSGPLAGQPVQLPIPPFQEEPAPFLLPDPEWRPGTFGESVRNLDALMAAPRPGLLPRVDAGPVVLAANSALAPGFSFYWRDQPDVPVTGLDPGSLVDAAHDAPWEAVYVLRMSPQGWLETVMAEKPAPSAELNAAVIRLLRGSMLEVVSGDYFRRLVVSYLPPGGGTGN